MTSRTKDQGGVGPTSAGESTRRSVPPQEPAASPHSSAQIALLMGLGWLIPGAGHFMQRKWVRGFCFLALVCFSVAMGAFLEGKLFTMEAGRPLATLGTLASMGAGFPFLVLRWMMDYQGDIRSATYEYGGAFLLTAGLMNIMALLDVWDVARGTKP